MSLIADTVLTFLADSNEDRPPDGLWHPSSLFQCDRQAVYLVRGTPETDPKQPEDFKPLAMGKLIHELVQASVTHGATKEHGPIIGAHHEVKVLIGPLNITGSADSLVLLAGEWGTEYELEEFKSTKSSGIKWAKPNFEPKPNHVAQALTYAYGIKHFPWFTTEPDGTLMRHDPLGGKMKNIRITYFGKDAFEILEFTYELTPEWEQSLVDYIKGLDKYRHDGVALPPRMARDDKGKKNWLCGYCQFRTRCWSAEDGEGVEL